MYCPFCRASSTSVKDTRVQSLFFTKRKRLCSKCGKEFTTLEKITTNAVSVMKKSGTVKDFNEDKIFSSIFHIAKKSDVNTKQLDKIFYEILSKIETKRGACVTTKEITKIVLEVLLLFSKQLHKRYKLIYGEKTK